MKRSQAIKKAQANSLAQLDNEVKVELSRIFDNASNVVESYEEKQVSGVQVRQSAFGWLNKINYLLEELPDNHPLKKKGGSVQKLVNKLTELTSTPNSEITYDMMVAGGKPPSLSKQRFLKPIETLFSQAKEDVIKPSFVPGLDTAVSVDNKPAGHLTGREGAVIDKPKDNPRGIPKAPARQQMRREDLPQQVTDKKPQTTEVLHPSGAIPGYVTNKVISIANDRRKFVYDLAEEMNSIETFIEKASLVADKTRDSMNKVFHATYKNHMFLIEQIDMNNAYTHATDMKPGIDSAEQESAKEIVDGYKKIHKNIKGIQPFIGQAASLIQRIEQENGGMPAGNNWADSIVGLDNLITSYIDAYNNSGVSSGDYEALINTGKNNQFLHLLDQIMTSIYESSILNIATHGANISAAYYDRVVDAYNDLLSIGKSKDIYNEFIKINGTDIPVNGVSSAVGRYIETKVGKI